MNDTAADQQNGPVVDRQACEQCGKPVPPRKSPGGGAKRFCSKACIGRSFYEKRRAAAADQQNGPVVDRHKRRPLPEAATRAAWALRKDVERIERIFADDRFAQNEEQVTAQLRGHLAYAAEVCHDLLSRIPSLTGE
jgi:hypothetical protein